MRLFPDSNNTAVYTTRQVIREGLPVLYVYHDEDDGAWQFMCGTSNKVSDGMVVALEEVLELDPSLEELGDLPLGWMAWRASRGKPWSRMINPRVGDS